ncbi:MAG: carboxypeptidase regulatory-like domain-containing protein, partial [Blastocatellia bacterium]
MRQFSKIGTVAKSMGLMLALLLAVGLMPSYASAQVLYGSLVGNVADQNGAVIAGATVTITNKGTGQVREATTNADGEYLILNVQPSDYDLKVTKQGFTSYTQTGLAITANNALRIDVSLKPGNVSENVTVQADVTALQTESSSVKAEINSKEIQALPINNYRNYQSLLNLIPGTTPAGFQNANTDTPERALTTNVNGTARNNNNTRLDGAQSVNIWLPHHSAYVPPSESIQEVNISTNNFDAEQGLAGGAAIQVITKSGTNQFHGSAFAYHDNHLFRARNAFQPLALGTNKPKNLRTIPGATIGGPIIKDKLFFFGSWEGMFERLIRDGRRSVPTADLRTVTTGVNFTPYNTIFDPYTGTLMNGTDRTAFNGNIIPANRISAVALKILPLIPLPNLPGATNNYYTSGTQVFNRNNYDVKVNWNRNERHQVWTKFSHMKADVTGQFALGAAGGDCVCDGGSGTGLTKSYVGTVGHTWTVGSGFVVDGNFSVTHRSHSTTGADYGKNIGLDVLGIPGTNGPDIRQSGFPQIGYGYSGLGNQNGWSPVFREERSYTFAQNAAKIKNNHTFRLGVDIVKHELNHWQPEIGVGPRGAVTYGAGATTLGGAGATQYNAFAAFLLGSATSVDKSLQNELMTTRELQMGFFVSDRWQVTRNLTLNLGMRYELFPIMHRADRGIERLDIDPRNP